MTKKEYSKLLFERLDVNHKGIKLNKVMCALIMFYSAGNYKVLGSWKTLSRFIFSLDTTEIEKDDLNSCLVTFGFYPTRNDHQELMNTVVRRLGNDVSYFDVSRWRYNKISISPRNVLKSLANVFTRLKGIDISFKNKLLFAANLTYYINTIDRLGKIDATNVKKYLCLANSLDIENLLTQWLSARGVKTYSLMEGVYLIQDSELPIANIAFENLTSDIQLCWGQYSKDEFIKFGYPPERMDIAGYPKDVKGQALKNGNPFKKGVVLLSQYIMETQNLRLIDILSKYADRQEFYLKLHPSLDYGKYAKLAQERGMVMVPKNMTVNDCVDNTRFDFAIAISSSAYYEALMRGLPCFRYYDGSYSLMAGCDDLFDDEESYKRQVDRILALPLSEHQKEIDDVLEYCVGWNIDRYKEILNA